MLGTRVVQHLMGSVGSEVAQPAAEIIDVDGVRTIQADEKHPVLVSAYRVH